MPVSGRSGARPDRRIRIRPARDGPRGAALPTASRGEGPPVERPGGRGAGWSGRVGPGDRARDCL
ncbi:hypothetical protein Ppa06_55150 [Planomonospora parontospora subsp. parontospora]|uniref:Uncharacterized protein n=2 Tax=Planomonospora parontospora TaxID=58119 RepID=A0AA37F7H8_9ACTN|nr:hypothetical protein GCM10010126_56610 [Planomonospora parontospora]GII11717.1 hypothetical protein Ppa06_55150 [Planomonospora parontospora subsp. parontospora]